MEVHGRKEGWHSNCSVKKVMTLKNLGDSCNRDGRNVPATSRRPRRRRPLNFGARNDEDGSQGNKTYKKTIDSSAKKLCTKSAKTEGPCETFQNGSVDCEMSFKSTECRSRHSRRRHRIRCVSRSVQTVKRKRPPILASLNFKQNQFDSKSGTCASIGRSKYKGSLLELSLRRSNRRMPHAEIAPIKLTTEALSSGCVRVLRAPVSAHWWQKLVPVFEGPDPCSSSFNDRSGTVQVTSRFRNARTLYVEHRVMRGQASACRSAVLHPGNPYA